MRNARVAASASGTTCGVATLAGRAGAKGRGNWVWFVSLGKASITVVGSIGASLQTLVGGNISLYTELCEQARQEAFDLMVQHAREVGANAVIGMRYDANEVAQGVTEVLAYGTAVVIEAVPESSARAT